MRRYGENSEEIRVALLRDAATPEGADSAALARQYTEHRVAVVRKKLGLICANCGHARRYFLTQEAADSFARSHVTKREKIASGQYQPDVTRSRAQRAGWDKDAPPIITSKTKVTIAPPPPTGYYRSNWFKGQ